MLDRKDERKVQEEVCEEFGESCQFKEDAVCAILSSSLLRPERRERSKH